MQGAVSCLGDSSFRLKEWHIMTNIGRNSNNSIEKNS